MRELQGTGLGALLDDDRLSVSGWTDGSYTASTARHSNFPVAYNDRANTSAVYRSAASTVAISSSGSMGF
jgi:hypothetical protein